MPPNEAAMRDQPERRLVRRDGRTTTIATDGAGLDFRVTDDGPGLTPRVAEQAFHRFTSLDGRGGSGLGLAIGRAFAQRHGGTLTYAADASVLRIPSVLAQDPERGAQL